MPYRASSPTLLLKLGAGRLADMSQTFRLTAAVTPDGDWYVARCVEVEVTSQGRTFDEALTNLREALELYFEDEPVPNLPPESVVTPVEVRLSA